MDGNAMDKRRREVALSAMLCLVATFTVPVSASGERGGGVRTDRSQLTEMREICRQARPCFTAPGF